MKRHKHRIAGVDEDAAMFASLIEAQVAAEGIVGPVISVGQGARIRTIALDVAGPDWSFRPFVDVARSNRIVVTATAFHGKVEA